MLKWGKCVGGGCILIFISISSWNRGKLEYFKVIYYLEHAEIRDRECPLFYLTA